MQSKSSLLRASGLRDTVPRRLILQALEGSAPMTPADIHAAIRNARGSVNLVTVYRVLSQFARVGLVHRHPCNGAFAVCTMPGIAGHHGFLHCGNCGGIDEFVNQDLCRTEDRIARAKGFAPSEHVTEILGTCSACLTR